MFPTSAILGTYWAMIMIYNFVFLTFSLRIFHLKKPNAEGQLVRNIPWPCISLTISTRSKAPVHAPTEMAVACISCLVVDWFIDPCCRGVEIKVCLVRLISWVDVIVGDWKFGDPRIPVIWCPCIPRMSFRNTAYLCKWYFSNALLPVPEHGEIYVPLRSWSIVVESFIQIQNSE